MLSSATQLLVQEEISIVMDRRAILSLVVIAFLLVMSRSRAQEAPAPPDAPLPPIPELQTRQTPAGSQEHAPSRQDGQDRFPGLFFKGYRADPETSRPADTGGDPVKEEARYRDCLARAVRDPDHALDLAFRWDTDGGGLPAEHCIAIALVTMGHPEAAADRLTDMLAKLRRGEGLPWDPLGGPTSVDALAAGLYAQLGNAHLLADDPEHAIDAFTRALAIIPAGHLDLEQQLYIDRARAEGILRRFPEAIADLDRAEAIDPEVADIYVLRASAYRALGQFSKAADDLARARTLKPDWPLLWLEEANLNAMKGDMKAARALWVEIASRWPESAEAAAARRNLARFDARADDTGG